MSSVQTLQSAYAAFANNDPSLLFGAMAPDIQWNEAEGNPLADRNPYVGGQAVGEGVFGRLLAAIDSFTAAPDRFVDVSPQYEDELDDVVASDLDGLLVLAAEAALL